MQAPSASRHFACFRPELKSAAATPGPVITGTGRAQYQFRIILLYGCQKSGYLRLTDRAERNSIAASLDLEVRHERSWDHEDRNTGRGDGRPGAGSKRRCVGPVGSPGETALQHSARTAACEHTAATGSAGLNLSAALYLPATVGHPA